MRQAEHTLTEENFTYICQFIYDHTGIVLGENKREMVYRRLTRIIRQLKLSSFDDYCAQLRASPEQELSFLVNAMTTNLTSFFREQHHFDYLKTHELHSLLVKNKQQKRIRIWSSACSTGEEPYSIAMTVFDVLSSYFSSWDIKILATDIDSNVVTRAIQGTYPIERTTDMSKDCANKYFVKETSNETKEECMTVQPKLKALITFKQLNLLHEWPMKGPFDIIFCRNVIIYFDKETQQELFARFYELLAPGGLLILGHSENLGSYQQYFSNEGRTMYRKPM